MKTEIKIQVRSYLVQIKDARTGEKTEDRIVLDKAMLQAAAMIGMSDEDLICRMYNRQGFRVLKIGTPHKREISVDLHQIDKDYVMRRSGI